MVRRTLVPWQPWAAIGFVALLATPKSTCSAQSPSLWESRLRQAASQEKAVPPFLEQPFAPLLTDTKTFKVESLNAAFPLLLNQQAKLQPALYLAARTDPEAALPLLEKSFRESKEAGDKIGAAIAIRRFGGSKAAPALRALAKSIQDQDVSDWANLLLSELTGERIKAETRPLDTGASYFDQVIPLQISLDLFFPQKDGKVYSLTLSPRDVRHVYGQAFACTNFKSRNDRLVIAKHLMVGDRLHIEGFLFNGMTFHPNEETGVVNFRSNTKRTLYLSGMLFDRSAGTIEADMEVARVANWHAPTPESWNNIPPVRFVGGEVTGWLYVDPQAMNDDKDGDGNPFDPGEAQLSSHTLVGPGKANGYFSGTFHGKSSDVNGDGKVDLIAITPLVNQDGEIDLNSDGVADEKGLNQTRVPIDAAVLKRR